MKKTTKGALSAAAAGTLLLGGAGSFAFWTSSATVDGGSIASGKMYLTSVTCASDWSHAEGAGGAVTLIVPGDTITKHCTGNLHLEGDHIGATVTLDPATLSSLNGSLGSEVTAQAVMTEPGPTVTGAGDHAVAIDINVQFPDSVTSTSSQDSTAALNVLTLKATQTHN